LPGQSTSHCVGRTSVAQASLGCGRSVHPTLTTVGERWRTFRRREARLASAGRLARGALVYVEQRGAFELLWRGEQGGGRCLLTLVAWPRHL